MTVKNIECQIAINQITRLLYGEGISAEVERDLKRHLANCPECIQALERRKALLQAMLKHDAAVEKRPTQFVKTPNVNFVPTKTIAETIPTPLTNVAANSQVEKPKARTVVGWKPIAYCATLAIVLFGMSYIMRDPTRIFGDRAIGEELGPNAPTTQVLSSGPEIRKDNTTTQTTPKVSTAAKSIEQANTTATTDTAKTSTDSSTPTTPANNKENIEPAEPSAAAPAKSIPPAATKTKAPVKAVVTTPKPQKPKRGTLRVYAPDGTILVH